MFDLYDNDFDKAFDEAVDAIERKASEKKHGRLIDADELIELIDDDISSLNMPREGYDVCLCTLEMMKQYIKVLPTVEDEPSKLREVIEPYIEFCEWVADTVLYEDFEDKWTLGAFAEVACRKLHKLGLVRKDGEYWTMDEVTE